jgi:hypothetical protein
MLISNKVGVYGNQCVLNGQYGSNIYETIEIKILVTEIIPNA